MGESLTMVVAIFLAAIMMFVFPMMAMSERSDDIAELNVQAAITEFVNTSRNTGKITADSYNKLVSDLYSTGNTYDIAMEIQVLDENPSKKQTEIMGQSDKKIGENIYYSIYTSQIMEDLENKEKQYTSYMKQGDILTVTASNTNSTISQMLKNFFYSLSGNDSYSIVGKDSGVVTVTGK